MNGKWDRLYNVDFYIEVSGKYIGIQIKPITYNQAPEIHKWKELLSETHEKFEKEYGGKERNRQIKKALKFYYEGTKPKN